MSLAHHYWQFSRINLDTNLDYAERHSQQDELISTFTTSINKLSWSCKGKQIFMPTKELEYFWECSIFQWTSKKHMLSYICLAISKWVANLSTCTNAH